jgi:hypothetical protein
MWRLVDSGVTFWTTEILSGSFGILCIPSNTGDI